MEQKNISSSLILAAIIVSGSVLFSQRANSQAVNEPIKSSSSDVIWEYKVMSPDSGAKDLQESRRAALEQQLVAPGNEGWELVEMPYLKGVRYQMMIFKRLKQ